jgi:O-acetyl-ADP-ribose deacetylase (regulator of RNase III)
VIFATQKETDDANSAEETVSSVSSSLTYDEQEDKKNKGPVLDVSDIPTLRSMYRSRRLLQRDQSFAPNDSYNQIISFCYHDLTRLKVDAIVNSANRAMKVSNGDTLNNAIHRAAGPGLIKETQTKGWLKPGEAVITNGYDLPSSHIIHAARPGYSNTKSKHQLGQFNQLIDCYRGALKVAVQHELKTIAFPCLGTGGVGFPARVAARIALQEMREYLDATPTYPFERIVFCVNTAADELAYRDFFPVFFPPTHGDLGK